MLYEHEADEVTTTIGEIMDAIGLAAVKICPDGLNKEEIYAFMKPFAIVSYMVAAHFSGVEPFDQFELLQAAMVRRLFPFTDRSEKEGNT